MKTNWFLILLVLILMFLLYQTSEEKTLYIDKLLETQKNLDSLRKEYQVLLNKEDSIVNHLRIVEEKLKQKRVEKEKIFISVPVVYTDEQIDSILTAWYPR